MLIAPDSFKGSLPAQKVADNIELGIITGYSNVKTFKLPLADGGEGTVDALINARNGKKNIQEGY